MEYCLICGERNPEDREICECGGRSFAYGAGFKMQDRKIVCDCGRETFTLGMHINMGKIHEYKYRCECGNVINVQRYTGK